MYLVQPYLLRSVNQSLVWKISGSQKVIYLTFDDGPIPEITPFILSTLDKYNAKATFFCVGDNLRKHPDEFKQIINAGHIIGNHTFHHINGWRTRSSAYAANVELCQRLTGSNLFRPPYGRITPTQIHKLKKQYHIILWSVLTGDFDKNTTPAKCLSNAIRFTKTGSIVVFHENIKAKPRLFYALPRFLEHFSRKGYSFEVITEEILEATYKNKLFINSNRFGLSNANPSLLPDNQR